MKPEDRMVGGLPWESNECNSIMPVITRLQSYEYLEISKKALVDFATRVIKIGCGGDSEIPTFENYVIQTIRMALNDAILVTFGGLKAPFIVGSIRNNKGKMSNIVFALSYEREVITECLGCMDICY